MSKLKLDADSKLKLDADSYLLLDSEGEGKGQIVYNAKRHRKKHLA